MNMSAITVPTSETCSVAFWMTDLVKRHRPVMLAGPSGTGKTQQVNGILKAMDPAAFLSATINFNFYTTSAVLGNTMCLPLEKKTGTNFGADSVSCPQHDPKLNFVEMASRHLHTIDGAVRESIVTASFPRRTAGHRPLGLFRGRPELAGGRQVHDAVGHRVAAPADGVRAHLRHDQISSKSGADAASRRVEAPSRHLHESSPGEEAVRTDLTEMLRA